MREDRFDLFLARATSEVDNWVTQEVTALTTDAYMKCICEVLEVIENPEVLNESAEGVSVTYAQVRLISDVVKRRLGRTGLIYQGI